MFRLLRFVFRHLARIVGSCLILGGVTLGAYVMLRTEQHLSIKYVPEMRTGRWGLTADIATVFVWLSIVSSVVAQRHRGAGER